jgi:hypothetical protein
MGQSHNALSHNQIAVNQTSVSYLWREPHAANGFATGVSLHSHTSQSRETLDFIAELSTDWAFLQPIMRWFEARSLNTSGIRPDYARSYWTPPLTPRLAFDLERSQIENSLQLPALVSITDHDSIQAPLLLRSLPTARHIPVSVEWTVPFGKSAFHLGVHNLPSETGASWMARLEDFTTRNTALPIEERNPAELRDILAQLDDLPNVLLIFNHPMWDLYRIGDDPHTVLVNDFLARYGQFIHALELNGLRNWKENRDVASLAARWNQLVISGGDRHGMEPNANLNLTRATTFTGFVHEVRRERRSHVLFMPQYAEPWKHRILQSTLDAIRDYPQFPPGHRRWDERAFHPDADGVIRPLAEIWGRHHGVTGTYRAPRMVTAVLSMVRLLGTAPVGSGLRYAWNDTSEMRATLSTKTTA